MGPVTQPIPQQPATPPGSYPPPAYRAVPGGAEEVVCRAIIRILAAFFVPPGRRGVGGYFVYRAVGDDHCGICRCSGEHCDVGD